MSIPLTFASRPRALPICVFIIIAAVTLWLYVGIFGVTFLADDTIDYIQGKYVVEHEIWYPFIGKGMWPGGPQYYRPLTIVTYGLDAILFGYSPAAHRATQLLWHLLCCAAVYALYRSWLGKEREGPAALAALLFALHPVHEYPMWWTGARYDVMCGVFYAAAALCFTAYARERRMRSLVFACLATAAALGSKEMAYSLPLVCFAIYLAHAEDTRGAARRLWSAVWATAPIAAVASAFMLFRLVRFDLGSTTLGVRVGPGHIVEALHSATRGLVFPFDISAREMLREHPAITIAATIIIVALALPGIGRLRSRLVALGIAWIALSLLPVVRTMAPWTLYIPSIGSCLVAGIVFTPDRSRSGIAGLALAALLLTSYVAQWEQRKNVWRAVDKAADQFMTTLRSDYRQQPFERALFLVVPGSIGDVPLYMQYFSLRLPLEMPEGAPKTTVISVAVLPADAESQGVSIHELSRGAWQIELESGKAYFAFSENPKALYKFDRGDVGDVTWLPWGSTEIVAEHPNGQPSAIVVRLQGDYQSLADGPIYYFSRGELVRYKR